MHLPRTSEIKGSDKSSVTPWPLLSSCSCRAMSCKPHPSTLNWGTEQPSLCPALQVSLQPRGQRGSRAFLLNQTEKHNPSLLFNATFTGKDPSAPAPPNSLDFQTMEFSTERWLCPGAQRLGRHCPVHGMWLLGLAATQTRLETALEGSIALSLRANEWFCLFWKKAFSTITDSKGKWIHTVTSVFKKPTQQASGVREWKVWSNS